METKSKATKKPLKDKEDELKINTRQFSNPLIRGAINILTQNQNETAPISHDVLMDDIEQIVKQTQKGDTKAMLTILTANILQLQLFNGNITNNLMGEAGKGLDSYEKLSKIQIKVMQETRKSIMAMNEICNPKRTTFIKEANQHNHLHQKNSEKKLENENELQKTEQLPTAETFTEAEIIKFKEKVK